MVLDELGAAVRDVAVERTAVTQQTLAAGVLPELPRMTDRIRVLGRVGWIPFAVNVRSRRRGRRLVGLQVPGELVSAAVGPAGEPQMWIDRWHRRVHIIRVALTRINDRPEARDREDAVGKVDRELRQRRF